ncbi:hypothetical protein KIN20_027554 [Parelaphostrongylus tenuis]|uniref:Uncharacterized protein n=1 Tax=Parelaphostrongylus tenuis TaxID=148309 RepID=A0AAD5QZR7_PARTN|nr:hypothetical protein KIN20_027554 [Parelaphostrongylus tenuis]
MDRDDSISALHLLVSGCVTAQAILNQEELVVLLVDTFNSRNDPDSGGDAGDCVEN